MFSLQIYHEGKKFTKAYNLTVTCVYGGESKWEQSTAVKEGCEMLVATPGRLIDLVKIKATNLQRNIRSFIICSGKYGIVNMLGCVVCYHKNNFGTFYFFEVAQPSCCYKT